MPHSVSKRHNFLRFKWKRCFLQRKPSCIFARNFTLLSLVVGDGAAVVGELGCPAGAALDEAPDLEVTPCAEDGPVHQGEGAAVLHGVTLYCTALR